MDKDTFIGLWNRHFPGQELPIAFFFADEPGATEPPAEHHCFIAQLARARKGRPLHFNAGSVICPGGKRYLGFSQDIMPNFEYFLSCGVPGQLEGERYKKTPEIVKEVMGKAPTFIAPAPYIVFKRWDCLDDGDTPEVVIFFAQADVLSGLFTLAGFDEADPYAVVAPFSAGCGSIVQHPYLEQHSDHPRAVLGMFDVSARPWVPKDVLTLAAPMRLFTRMVKNMDESFLITPSWERVRSRL